MSQGAFVEDLGFVLVAEWDDLIRSSKRFSWNMSGTARILRSAFCSGGSNRGSYRPFCAEPVCSRKRDFSAARGSSGDGSGSSIGDFKIDFSQYFTTPSSDSSTNESQSGASKKETLDLNRSSVEKTSAVSEGESDSGKTGRRLLDILAAAAEKGEGTTPTNKYKLDLRKLFPNAEQKAARAPGEGSAEGSNKPFKLDLSTLKNLSASDDNATFKDRRFRPNMGRFTKPAASNLTDSARRELSLQKLGHLSRFGSPQSLGFNVLAPKEHMLEKYFAIENMSLAERHKIELRIACESFRMHDADCGSTPVQISLLSQKIKYLSHHLSTNKKDKHSRRGLEAMIEKRRRLLMYLRRKDWETYCYMLSTLGLRDKLEVAHA